MTNKKYLVSGEKVDLFGDKVLEFGTKDAKEVEILSENETNLVLLKYQRNPDSNEWFSRYLAANNLQIIKTVK